MAEWEGIGLGLGVNVLVHDNGGSLVGHDCGVGAV